MPRGIGTHVLLLLNLILWGNLTMSHHDHRDSWHPELGNGAEAVDAGMHKSAESVSRRARQLRDAQA